MYKHSFKLGNNFIGRGKPCYFIADIAANHDGSRNRAIDLIYAAKEAGADCAKFQHFTANTIVSDFGFQGSMAKVSHQSGWKKSVFEIYDEYHTREEWTSDLVAACKDASIDFMTTPYNLEITKILDALVVGYKIGSGDITYKDLLEKLASKNKPLLLATGASNMDEVIDAVGLLLGGSDELCLMQCNTNYTGSLENFKFSNLRVIETFSKIWPGMPLGLSDHTPGHSAVLGAVALGACVVEKHFTDDNSRVGPDHSFALNPITWRSMVEATRELEFALGDGEKGIEKNERETVIIQRRALRAAKDLCIGEIIDEKMFEALRPCPTEAISPMEVQKIIGKTLKVNIARGNIITWDDVL